MSGGELFPAGAPEEVVRLHGVLERSLFQDAETGYQILKVRVDGEKDAITVTGYTTSRAGERVEIAGTWIEHPKFGRQLKAASVVTEIPTTKEGLVAFLSSGLIKGLGKTYAQRIVDYFGELTIDVLDNSPMRLQEVPGIGPQRSEKIIQGWKEQYAIRSIMIFLQSHGVSTSQAVRIYKAYGADAVSKIKKNPYILAKDIRGIGFKSADAIALSMGIEPSSLYRLRAGVNHVLTECMGNGHCGLPRETLTSKSARLLGVRNDLIYAAINEELAGGNPTMEADRSMIYISSLVKKERLIAERLLALRSGSPPWMVGDAEREVDWVQQLLPFPLAAKQKTAIASALTNKVSVITGGPGVGKTTILNAVLKILGKQKIKIVLAAPTGKAAKRMSESTGKESMTIHRLLGLHHGSERDTDEPIACDLLVVDESSMIDIPLMSVLLSALPLHAAVLIVGDVDQLPSVGPGQVLADIIRSGAVAVARLDEIRRQAEGSLIITNAHRINSGEIPVSGEGPNSDFYFIRAGDQQRIVEVIRQLVVERVPKAFGFDPMKDVQILCPMNRSETGNWALNALMQELLNPTPSASVTRNDTRYGVGDRVMQVENNYDKEVFNGDMGVVFSVDVEESELVVDFDGVHVAYDFGELIQLSLAFSMTIHKSQGSEFPVVIMPISMDHRSMLARNLFYTGLTRGRKLVVLVGQEQALSIAVKNDSSMKRNTRLHEFLVEMA